MSDHTIMVIWVIKIFFFVQFFSVFPDSSVGKESAYTAGDPVQFLGQEDPPKKGNAKECSNYHTIALISQASKIMLVEEKP